MRTVPWSCSTGALSATVRGSRSRRPAHMVWIRPRPTGKAGAGASGSSVIGHCGAITHRPPHGTLLGLDDRRVGGAATERTGTNATHVALDRPESLSIDFHGVQILIRAASAEPRGVPNRSSSMSIDFPQV